MTREEWLLAAYHRLAGKFKDHGKLPEKVAIITSWTQKRTKKNILGACYSPGWTKDSTTYITITPEMGKEEAADVLATLMHEMVHALGIMKHNKDFGKVAKSIGLQKPWTATTPTEALAEELKAIAAELGEYPHKKMIPPPKILNEKPKTNGGAMKFVSPVNPTYNVFIYKKWVEDFGAPICPISHEPMVEAGE